MIIGKYFLIIFFFTIGIDAYKNSYSRSKVRLEDMQYIIAKIDKYTATQLQIPKKQLVCVGGNASTDYHKVKNIICRNMGIIDESLPDPVINWQCISTLEKGYSLDNIVINCEPYIDFFKSKKYILYDSCAIHYELNYSDTDNSGRQAINLDIKNIKSKLGTSTRLNSFIVVIIIICIFSIGMLFYLSDIFGCSIEKNKNDKNNKKNYKKLDLPIVMPDLSTNLENSFVEE